MISPETRAQIRRYFYVEHWKVGTIARELGVPAPTRRIPYRLGVMLGAAAETGGRLAHLRQPPPVMRYGMQLLGGENRFNISRARHELGFRPKVNLAEGIARSVDWYRTAYAPAAAALAGRA